MPTKSCSVLQSQQWFLLLVISTISASSISAFSPAAPTRHLTKRGAPQSVVGNAMLTRPVRRYELSSSSVDVEEDTAVAVKTRDLMQDGNDEIGAVFPSAPNASPAVSEQTLGLLALLTVPVLWGTYAPIVRFMYELETPMPGFLFSSLYFTVAAITTTTLAMVRPQVPSESGADSGGLLERAASIYGHAPTMMGGIELGFYVLLANCLQVVGLETVPSDRAGFLMQMSTVLVPLVSALMARNIKKVDGRTWLACLMAFVGIVAMNAPAQDALSPMSILSSFSGGEGLVVGAALMYSMNVIRISDYAPHTDPLRLTAAKATVEATLSWSIVAGLILAAGDSVGEISTEPQTGLMAFAQSAGEGILDFFSAFGARLEEGTVSLGLVAKMGGAISWAGLMCTAFVVSVQSYGQRLVSPSDANLIYSLQPIFTAVFASVLLGEQLDSSGFLGGGIILAAVMLVATKNLGTEDEAAL